MPIRYLMYLLHLHQQAALGEMLSSLQASVVQRTARSALGRIPPEAIRLDVHVHVHICMYLHAPWLDGCCAQNLGPRRG